MKLKIPVEFDLNGIDGIIDEIKCLQTYKLFEGDDMVLVSLDDVAEILINHIEAKRKLEPQKIKGKWTDDNACPFCEYQPLYERDIHTLSYCPNCGADMRGEDDG